MGAATLDQSAATDHPILDVLVERWSPRAYDAAVTIDEQKLNNALEAARWAPSAMNVQPWRFIVARRGTATHAAVVESLMGFNQAWAPNASALVVAQGGLPPLATSFWTLAGLGLSIGGSSALNHVLDRDLDRRMKRTRLRPVAVGTIGPVAATVFSLSLFTLGGTILCLYVNTLAAWCALFGGVFYDFAYTPLKLRTPLCTLVGAVPGALPPVTGWVAAREQLGVGA